MLENRAPLGGLPRGGDGGRARYPPTRRMPLDKQPGAEPIPGYRLLEPLGQGGFGEVWKCEAPGGLLKAVKFVGGGLPALHDNGSGAAQEWKALQHIKAVRHPFVLSLDRAEVVGGELVLVMELADRSLQDLFDEYREDGGRGVPRAELLRYLRETAEALDVLNQEHRLLHLDVKPRNLFLFGRHVKVADFGLVGSLSDLTGPGCSAPTDGLTPLYAAPESFQGKVSAFSDQYSLAVVYYQLLTGRLPFTGKSYHHLALKHATEEADLTCLPAADRPVMARALAKDPNRRFPSCGDFVESLAAAKRARLPKEVLEAAGPPTELSGDTRSGGYTEAGRAVLTGYRFLACLGRGPHGEVWRARAPDGRGKLVRYVFGLHWPAAAEREAAERLASLRHPALAGAEIGRDECGRLIVVTELPEYSLQDRLQQCQAHGGRGVPHDELIGHVTAVAEALDELYDREGLAHLGLSPGKLLLDDRSAEDGPDGDERVVVAEFGVAHLFWLPSGQPAAQLNARYSAPELFAGQAGRAADQYSLALIYAELLTGTHPLRRTPRGPRSPAATAADLDLSSVGSPERSVLQRALAPAPAARYATCGDFVRALGSALPDHVARLRGQPAVAAVARARAPSPPGGVLVGGGDVVWRPVETKVLVQDQCLLETVSELVTKATASAAASADAAERVVERADFRYLVRPDAALYHRCVAHLMPSVARLKLEGFRLQWLARLARCQGTEVTFHIEQSGSFWQNCLGRPPYVEVTVRLEQHPQGHELTGVQIEVRPVRCNEEQLAVFHEETGPRLLRDLRTYLQAQPDRRTLARLPFEQALEVRPMLDDLELGLVVPSQGKDISMSGMGLYLACEPPTRDVRIHLPRTVQGAVVAVPAKLVRVRQCEDGRFEAGAHFLIGPNAADAGGDW